MEKEVLGEDILGMVEGFRDEIAEICSNLVKIPTPNPPGKTDKCVRYIKEYFEDIGIPSKVYERRKGKANISVRIQGGSGGTVLWFGHLDVVPAGDPSLWRHDPYSGLITGDGVVYGRGSSDMKGSCAAAMAAAKLLYRYRDRLPNTVEFWFTCDEETGGEDGVRWLAQERMFEGDVCIIGDASGDPSKVSIDIGCKGSMRTTLRARGKTAHGSTPYLGDNAIEKVLSVIPYVKRIGNYRLKVSEELEPAIASTIQYLQRKPGLNEEQRKAIENLFHYPSVSLNIFQAGVKINVIPDKAEASFDIRLTSGVRVEDVREEMLRLVEEAGIPGVEVEVEAPFTETAGYYEPPSSSFVSQLSKAVEMVTGVKPFLKILTGGTDAIFIKKYTGIPCLGFGPVSEDQAHAPNEHVNINSLVTAAKAYTLFPLLYRKGG